jgi:hypothetical protein
MIMIRQETILIKLFLIKLSDMELLYAMQPSYKVCPNCGAVGCCKPHDTYERWMISIYDGGRKEYRICVQRILCNSCGSTHALLADILIPYSSYSLRFVLHVLRAYFYRRYTVAQLCEKFSIAIATIYKWKSLFFEQANLWLPVLEQIIQLSSQHLDYFENIDKLPSSFFQRYGFSFLQSRQTTRCSRGP